MDRQESTNAAESIVPPVAEPVRDDHLGCPRCGHDLTGASTNHCPECGKDLDAHLYCLHCDYDLTGAPTNRCPECGNEFDRAALADWYYKDNQPLPASDFLSLARMSVLEPVRLARGVPPSPCLKSATHYAAKVRRLAACLLFLGGALAPDRVEGMLTGVLLAILVFICSHACEVLLSLVFDALVRGRAGRSVLSYPFWRAMTACFSTFLMVSCGTHAVMCRSPYLTLGGDGGLLLLGSVAWWWLNLGRAVSARTEPTAGRVVALLLIPVVSAAVVALGFVLGGVAVVSVTVLLYGEK